MKKLIIISILLSLTAALSSVYAQSTYDGVVSVDSEVHDFGDVSVEDGSLSCSFEIKNIGTKPLLILSAVSSCGCTEAEWTREPIAPGKSGKVSATYNNDYGPYPFDKTITVYVSEMKKPIVLHLRGSVHEASKPIKENYPIIIGNMGIKSYEVKAGNLSMRETKSGEITIGNVGITPMKVEFKDVSDNLQLSVYPNPVPAKKTATLSYTIVANRSNWGKNWYYATPVIDGRVFKAVERSTPAAPELSEVYSERNTRVGKGKSEIAFWAVTKENFNNYSEQDKKDGANIIFAQSTASFGSIKRGAKTTITFNYTNKGKDVAKIFKLDADCHNITVKSMADTPGGKKGTITLELDTEGLPPGDIIFALNLFTNAPLRPVISLQITGTII